jgi:hypothetical protein
LGRPMMATTGRATAPLLYLFRSYDPTGKPKRQFPSPRAIQIH